jgi:hypothetical protein
MPEAKRRRKRFERENRKGKGENTAKKMRELDERIYRGRMLNENASVLGDMGALIVEIMSRNGRRQ